MGVTSETCSQNHISSDSNVGHSYRSTRVSPFALEKQEAKFLSSKELIYGGGLAENNFHKDTAYYRSPRAPPQVRESTSIPSSRESTDHVRFKEQPTMIEVARSRYLGLPRMETRQSHHDQESRYVGTPKMETRQGHSDQEAMTSRIYGQMAKIEATGGGGDTRALPPEAVRNALRRYPSSSSRPGRSRPSLADWVTVAKRKSALVDEMYLKAAKRINDEQAVTVPPQKNHHPSQLNPEVPNFEKLGSWYALGQRRLDPLPPYTGSQKLTAYPLKSQLRRPSDSGMPAAEVAKRNPITPMKPPYGVHYYETPSLPVNTPRSQPKQPQQTEPQQERSTEPPSRPRVAIDTQTTETQLSYQNPNEPRKLLLGMPDKDVEKFVRWYKGPNQTYDSATPPAPPKKQPSSPKLPKLDAKQPLQPSDLQLLEYQRESHERKEIRQLPARLVGPHPCEATESKNKVAGSISSKKLCESAQQRTQKVQEDSPKQISKASESHEKTVKEEKKRVEVEVPQWESQRYKLPPKEPTKGRQFFTALVRDEVNRLNEDHDPPQELPLWFTESEWALQSNGALYLSPREQMNAAESLQKVWQGNILNSSNEYFSTVNEDSSIVSDPLPRRYVSNHLESMESMALSVPENNKHVRHPIIDGRRTKKPTSSSICRPSFGSVRPWCHLGSNNGDSGYILTTPPLRRVDRRTNKEASKSMTINPIVKQTPTHGGDSCSTTFVPTKVMLYCKRGIMTIPSPYDVPQVNTFCQPKDLIMFNKDLPEGAKDQRRARFSVNLDGFLDEDVYFFTDKEGRRLIVEGRRPKRENLNARRLVETIDLPEGLQPENLKVARDYRGILYFEEAWVF